MSAGQPKGRRTTVETVDVSRCAINDESHDPVPIEVHVGPRFNSVGHSLEENSGYMYSPTHLGIMSLESSELGTLLQGAITLRPTMEVEPEGTGVWHSSVGKFTHRPTRPQCHQSSLPAIDAQPISTPIGSIAQEDPMSDDAQDEPQTMTQWLLPRTGTDKGSIQRRGAQRHRMVNRSS